MVCCRERIGNRVQYDGITRTHIDVDTVAITATATYHNDSSTRGGLVGPRSKLFESLFGGVCKCVGCVELEEKDGVAVTPRV